MARRKPASAKQKKAALQEQRAIKRGDLAEGTKEHSNVKVRTAVARSAALGTVDWQARAKAKELQSAFAGLSKEYVEQANRRAFNVPLPRPLDSKAVVYQTPVQLERIPDLANRVKELDEQLWCPVRPKWRHSMTKKELDRNEEGQFEKWLEGMDTIHQEYMRLPQTDDDTEKPRSPSFFERNLSVWRQLWRVTEQSQIILVMIDARCPPVHFPASLRSYLRNLVTPATRRRKEPQESNNGIATAKLPTPPKGANAGRKRVILVLTKTDLVDEGAASGWKQWCKDWWRYGYSTQADGEEDEVEDIEVVSVRSYADQPVEDQRGRRRHIPEIPHSALNDLLDALEAAHADLLQPPAVLLDQPEKLERWRKECFSKVKPVVNWQEFKQAIPDIAEHPLAEHGSEKGDEIIEHDEEQECEKADEEEKEAETLTIGLIGQPNCGKSSLLNALMGRSRVRASKTPGKTKHFQSLYWSRDVRIVDCPGLVLPSLTSVEMQVQAGVLPISQVSSVASCIYHIACALPLEKALKIAPPARWQEERERRLRIQSRITTRRQDEDEEHERRGPVTYERNTEDGESWEERWTAGDILQGWAEYRGYVTAKAGRPDTNRAGNEILRTVVEGRIPWRYLPSKSPLSSTNLELLEEGNGIWLPLETGLIPHDEDRRVSSAEDTEAEDSEQNSNEGSPVLEGVRNTTLSPQQSDAVSDSEDDGKMKTSRPLGTQSRFAALSLGMEEGVSDDDDEEGKADSAAST